MQWGSAVDAIEQHFSKCDEDSQGVLQANFRWI